MAVISEEEKLRCRRSIESVIGTKAMEGIFLDNPLLAWMRQFRLGEIEIQQFSAAAIHQHVREMDRSRQSSVQAQRTAADAA